MKRRTLFTVFWGVCCSLTGLAAGAAPEQSSPASASRPVAGSGPVVALDYYYNHEVQKGVQFHYTWEDTKPSGFSKLGRIFTDEGARLEKITTAPTAENLRPCAIYIIADPDTPAEAADGKPNYAQPAEIEAIVDWVKAGGKLVLMNNDMKNCDFQHINQLASRFGITFNEDLRNDTIGGDLSRARLWTRDFNQHPLFRGVQAIYMKQICTLSLKASARAILTADKESGAGKDAIMAVSKTGKGMVFAVGDPWIYNEYIDFTPKGLSIENHKAAVNLVRWLLGKIPE